MEKQNTEDDDLEKFGQKILRRSTRGSWESLLAQHLVQAVNAPVMQKIRLICEAAFMTDKPNLDLVEPLYYITSSFQYATVDGSATYISWPFPMTPDNFAKYVKPWLVLSVKDVFYIRRQEETKNYQGTQQALREGEQAKAFELMTSASGIWSVSFYRLQSQFQRWALPKAMGLFAELSKMVDPGLYETVLFAFAGKKGEQ